MGDLLADRHMAPDEHRLGRRMAIVNEQGDAGAYSEELAGWIEQVQSCHVCWDVCEGRVKDARGQSSGYELRERQMSLSQRIVWYKERWPRFPRENC
jgi:hypothetical protein